MSRMGDALISCWEAGTVPAEIDEVRSWRAAGHDVPITFVPVTNWQGREVQMPAIGLETAGRLATSLEDETARQTLAAAVRDAHGYLGMIGRRCSECGCTGQGHYFVTSLDGETLCVDCG